MAKRTVMVLGATGGLGRAVTERFRDDGASVLAFGCASIGGRVGAREARRALDAAELGPVAVLLASEDGAGITGQVWHADGGWRL